MVAGARTVFFKVFVADILKQMDGQANPDWREGVEVVAGMCVDDLASHFAKSAKCRGWLKALSRVHLIHIGTVNYSDNGASCRADGVADDGAAIREFEYVFVDDGKNFSIRGRLTGQWHLKPGTNI